jgi:hypothetical protein
MIIRRRIMEKLNRFFMTELVAGLVFTAVWAIPTQPAQALIGTSEIENDTVTSPKIKDGEVKAPDIANGTVTKEKLSLDAVKIVVISRTKQLYAPAVSAPAGDVQCKSDEVVTGGGFKLTGPENSQTVIFSNKVSNGWAVSFVNNADRPTSAIMYVQCAHLELGP